MAATHRPQNGPVTVHVVEAENEATLISNWQRLYVRKSFNQFPLHMILKPHRSFNCKDTLSPVAVMDAQPGLPWLTQRLKVMGPASALRNRGFRYYIHVDV